MKKLMSLTISMGLITALNAQVQNPAAGPTAISLAAPNVAYTQNFNKDNADGLNATSGTFTQLPAGWVFIEEGTGGDVNGQYRSGNGTSATRDVYSFGTSNTDNDRAFGVLTGTNLVNIKLGSKYKNSTGVAITSLTITYVGEQWRNGGSNTAGQLSFSYSTDATSLNAGTYTAVPSLNFTSPQSGTTATSLDGNQTANKTSKVFTITGLNIPINGEFWIRWENANGSAANTNDGLSIDDFSLVPNPPTTPVSLSFFNSTTSGNAINLKWETLTETNNDYFEILRSEDGTAFSSLIKLKGKGNSNAVNPYFYTDFNPYSGVNYYKLKQVDFDGTETEYPVIAAKILKDQSDFNFYSNGSQGYILEVNATETADYTFDIHNLNGKSIMSKKIRVEKGNNRIEFNAISFTPGVYIAVLAGSNQLYKKKFLAN